VKLIANTTTAKGLVVKCSLDENHYAKGIEVAKAEFANILLEKAEFHGDWNYRIIPQI
jgi:hypothetical protein